MNKRFYLLMIFTGSLLMSVVFGYALFNIEQDVHNTIMMTVFLLISVITLILSIYFLIKTKDED